MSVPQGKIVVNYFFLMGLTRTTSARLLEVAQNGGKLDQIAEGVTAEEAGPVRDRDIIVGGVPGRVELSARGFEVLGLQAEVARVLGVGRPRKEVQLEALGPGREPDQLHVLDAAWWPDFQESQHPSIEGAHRILPAERVRRGDVLQPSQFHEQVTSSGDCRYSRISASAP